MSVPPLSLFYAAHLSAYYAIIPIFRHKTDLGRGVYPDGSIEEDMVTELFEKRRSMR